MNENYFAGDIGDPYHLSVGAILRNSSGLVACHHFVEFHEVRDIYILTRETMEPDETLEGAVHRGLMEEFGATATITKFVGSIVSRYNSSLGEVQKTTLYFLCDLVEQNEKQRKPNDEEKDSIIGWQSSEFLIPKMKQQA